MNKEDINFLRDVICNEYAVPRDLLFNDTSKDNWMSAINKLGIPHEVKECPHFYTCNNGCYDKCVGCGIWMHKYIPNAPKDISQYDWQSEVINMAETTVNVNIEKKYFTDNCLSESDLEKLSDEHKEIVAALVKKYKEEDTTWINKNYPKSVEMNINNLKDYKNIICREAIKKFANELYKEYFDCPFSDKEYLRCIINKLGVELDKK